MKFTSSVALGARIVVEGENATYHTINTWGLAIVNTDYIKEPEQETAYIGIPFTDGFIDVSEVVAGRPVYKKREISVKLKGFREIKDWDNVISDIRNKLHGKICRVSFDNDKGHFWKGRVYVDDFTRTKTMGYFILNMPQADPYKYNWQGYGEPWVWDTFNFRNGVTYTLGEIEVNGTATITIPAGIIPVMPTFKCTGITNSLTVSDGVTTIELENGTNKDPRIEVNGKNEVTLTFTGHGKVTVTFRGGSL